MKFFSFLPVLKRRSLFLVFVLILHFSLGYAQSTFKVEVVGKGDPILLFPGFACTGDVWKDVTRELAKHHECHVFTFAGFGGVPPIGKPWLSKIKDAVVQYVHDLKLQEAIIIGHSLGGTLGLWLAATEPTLFKKIIVVDALPCMGTLMIPDYKADNIVYDNPYSKKLLEMDSAAFRSMAVQQCSFMMLNKEKQAEVVEWIMITDRPTYVYAYVDLLKLDLRKDLARIRIPVIVLAATHPGKAMIEKTYNEQYAKLSDKVFYYAEGSAHFIMYDQPQWLLSHITESLQ
jgi:pimeloyl-ACP methyl ester carboxylesterase